MWEMDVGGRIRTDFIAQARREEILLLRPSVRFGTLLGSEFTNNNAKYPILKKK